MGRPVSYNLIKKPLEADISMVEMPEGQQGEGFFATKLNNIIGLARKNSIWPLPFATSCCGIEFMATMGSHYDLGRFGSERVGFSPRQCDLLMVMGTIAKKMGPVVKQVYLQMAEPRWVISMGSCANGGGYYHYSYSVVRGCDWSSHSRAFVTRLSFSSLSLSGRYSCTALMQTAVAENVL